MKHPKIKRLGLLICLLSIILLGGCRSFIIPQDQPIALDNQYKARRNPQEKIEILAFDPIASGIIQDISYDGTTLLLLNTTEAPPITFDINLMKITDADNRLTSFINSDKRQVSALFDEYARGVFYIEENTSATSGSVNNQLIWTSIDKSTTKTLSIPEENVNKNFCTIGNDGAIYSNTNGQIIFTNTHGIRTIYQLNQNLIISDIAYIPDKKTVVFTASDPATPQKKNLYLSEIRENVNTLSFSLVDENVLNFSVKKDTSNLIYTQLYGDSRRIMSYNVDKSLQPSAISEGTFTSARYMPSGEQILYTQYSTSANKNSQSIWLMNTDGSNQLQISAPMILTSGIVPHPYKSCIYFSVEKRGDNSGIDAGKSLSQLYRIDFTIK